MYRKKYIVVVAAIFLLGIFSALWVYRTFDKPVTKPVSAEVTKSLGNRVSQPVSRPETSYEWMLTPAGVQKTLGDFPMGGAVSPDQQFMVVSNDGVGTQSLQVVDLAHEQVTQTIPYHAPQALYLGVSFSPDGKHVYASAGGNNKIRVYDFANGKLTEKAPIWLPATKKRSFYPAGLTVSPDGHFLYVANNIDNSVSKIDLTAQKIVATTPVGQKPYTVLLSRDGKRLYASNWGERSVTELNPSDLHVQRTVEVGLHPNALAENPVNGQVYVADSDSDEITVLSPSSGDVIVTHSLLSDGSKLTGAQPDALAVSADGKRLYVANAGNNDIAVLDTDSGSVWGLIPTAWYPTGVFYLKDQNRLLVLNAKGMGSGPNSIPNTKPQYVGNMMRGTLSFIDVPDLSALQAYTEQVNANNHPAQNNMDAIPRWKSTASPIKHIIYVIRENRTYDQVLGDMAKGNGDAKLVMFGKQITPNVHKLASQFVLLDNFFADAEVSAQGHNWATAAKANDYVEKNWPANYSNRNRGSDFEGGDQATYPQEGFLWDDALRAGVTFRDYGEFYKFGTSIPNDPTIGTRYDSDYMGWNLRYSDVDRYKEWAKEFHQFEQNGNLPQLEILRLPNDHTAGTHPGYWTPQSMVAQNDYALGLLVDTVSHSKYWQDTAIFVTEDDAQAGVDHVDSHRTISLVISPYTQTRGVDNTPYDTTSMLRTMELILGMKPLTQYDAAATPMLNVFTDKPHYGSYAAVIPEVATDRLNPRQSLTSRASELLDFSAEDRADENQLNHILWQATRGEEPYPDLGQSATEEDEGN